MRTVTKTSSEAAKEWREKNKGICTKCGEYSKWKVKGICAKCYNRGWRTTEKAKEIIKKDNEKRNKTRRKFGKPFWNTLFWHEMASKPCYVCGWNEATRDVHHIIPKSQGGDNSRENVITLCPNCHRKVHENMITTEMLRSLISV